MQDWKQMLRDFGETTGNQEKEEEKSNEAYLRKTSAKTEAAAHILQPLDVESWESAKSSFEVTTEKPADTQDTDIQDKNDDQEQ